MTKREAGSLGARDLTTFRHRTMIGRSAVDAVVAAQDQVLLDSLDRGRVGGRTQSVAPVDLVDPEVLDLDLGLADGLDDVRLAGDSLQLDLAAADLDDGLQDRDSLGRRRSAGGRRRTRLGRLGRGALRLGGGTAASTNLGAGPRLRPARCGQLERHGCQTQRRLLLLVGGDVAVELVAHGLQVACEVLGCGRAAVAPGEGCHDSEGCTDGDTCSRPTNGR